MTRIALIGDRDASFITHRALDAALEAMPPSVDARWMPSERAGEVTGEAYDGVWIAPGGPYRDDDAVASVIDRARLSDLPLLATCSGFQYAAVVLARKLAGIDAVHAETDPEHPDPFVAPLACSLVGETRLVTPVPGSRLATIIGTAPFEGFHYCGYGLAATAAARLEAAGVRHAAHAPDAGVEALELPGHPFFIATLFQAQMPVLESGELPPLIIAFVAAARAHAEGCSVMGHSVTAGYTVQ